jgi:hypothetical protein
LGGINHDDALLFGPDGETSNDLALSHCSTRAGRLHLFPNCQLGRLQRCIIFRFGLQLVRQHSIARHRSGARCRPGNPCDQQFPHMDLFACRIGAAVHLRIRLTTVPSVS